MEGWLAEFSVILSSMDSPLVQMKLSNWVAFVPTITIFVDGVMREIDIDSDLLEEIWFKNFWLLDKNQGANVSFNNCVERGKRVFVSNFVAAYE